MQWHQTAYSICIAANQCDLLFSLEEKQKQLNLIDAIKEFTICTPRAPTCINKCIHK